MSTRSQCQRSSQLDADSAYNRQVRLLVRVLPFVAREPCFALKGGTAINLFIRDMPRLSVDIDLTYVPVQDRLTSLVAARASLKRIASTMSGEPPYFATTLQEDRDAQLRVFVTAENVRVKIVSPIIRGTIYDPKPLDIRHFVAQEFGFASTNVVSMADLYGGKICAALDRQHPRDLFDVCTTPQSSVPSLYRRNSGAKIWTDRNRVRPEPRPTTACSGRPRKGHLTQKAMARHRAPVSRLCRELLTSHCVAEHRSHFGVVAPWMARRAAHDKDVDRRDPEMVRSAGHQAADLATHSG